MSNKTIKLRSVLRNGNREEALGQQAAFGPGETENQVINLYPELRDQVFEGFGGAITEAAGCTYAQMDEDRKRELCMQYFSPERMNYQMVRIPVDSCDFSLGEYTGFERPRQYILPMLCDAERAHRGPLSIMLSPWSPPVEWKTNDTRQQGGKLDPAHYGDYAEYLARYLLWYREQGFSVSRISLQNEPHAVQTWDSCIWTAGEQKTFLRDYMWPAMEKYALTDIEVYLWDHNKERAYEWLRDVVDETTDRIVAGTCVHWYSGDHFEALRLCREQYPHKKLMVSESCFEYRVYGAIEPVVAAQKFAHEIIGDLNSGIVAFCDWNLLLDERGGPCYAENFCLAPFLYDRREKELKSQLLSQYLAAFSEAIVPGSRRIALTRFSEQVEGTAWLRPDGTLALILLNKTDGEQEVCIRLEGEEAVLRLPPQSISSGIIDGDDGSSHS